MKRAPARAVLGALGLLLTIPGLATADTVKVTAARSDGSWTWQPDVRHAAPGDRVAWTNPTQKVHTVTAYGKGWSKSVTLQPGDRTSKAFSAKGSYYFRCTRHSHLHEGECHGMCGYVHVM